MKLSIKPSKMKAAPGDRSLTYTYKTASAEILIGNVGKKRILSIMFIENNEPGNGNAAKLIKYIDGYARQCRCNEFWFPTVLSVELVKMLIKRGFKLQIHNDELFGRVEVYVKVFKK